MKRSFRIERLLAAGAIAVGITAGPLTPAAHAAPAAPGVPTTIAVPAGNKVFLVGHAVGVQIYSCKTTPDGPKWGLTAPRANLYGDNGQLIGTHFGGPTWQANDGSAVVGRREADVTVDQTAIPWLRLAAASATPGPEGDRLANTTFIQRTATTGGLAPAAATCNTTTLGDTAEVPYTADYYFWKATGS
jgi:uncharacterized protein DUF3455